MTQQPLPMLPKALLFAAALVSGPVWSAVGCDLNFPDRDVARLLPGSTGYRTVSVEIQKLGGDRMLARIEDRLRDQLRGLYETIDVPYTIYVVVRNGEVIGYIHGVNQKGYYGGIQIFLALGLDLRIKAFYIQKMSGGYAGKFTVPAFEGKFAGLALADFDKYEVATGQATGKLAAVKNPAPEAEQDFRNILRGIKKNLILVQEFFSMSPDLAPRVDEPVKK